MKVNYSVNPCHNYILHHRIDLNLYKQIKMKGLLLLIILLSIFTGSPNDKIIGKWYTENKEGVVEIFKQGDKYYGKLISLKTPNDSDGNPRKDTKNGDSKLKSRNLIGIMIFRDMEYSSKDNRWENGTIYDPLMGHSAKGFITVIDNNSIKVKGYLGVEWIGKSQEWKRKSE